MASLEKKLGRRACDGEGTGFNLLGVLRETGDVVGDVALWLVSEEHRTGEVGFVLKPEFTGSRLRHRDGARRCSGSASTSSACTGSSAGWTRATPRPRAVLERLGMRREALLVDNEWVKGEWTSELAYALLADEWATSPASRSSA